MIQTIQTASFTLTTQQIKALELMHEFLKSTKNLFLILGYAGTGKAQPVNTPVLTSTGWTQIGNLKPGDSVISGDGSRVEVLGVFPQGIKPIARVNFSDGSSTLCCYDHLWVTETYHERNANRTRGYKAQKKGKIPEPRIGRVKTTREIAESLLARNGTQKNHRIPVMKCADFDVVNVPVAPYLLGCLLGDGCLMQGTPKLTTADAEVAKFCSKLVPKGVEMKFITGKECLEYTFVGTQWQGQWRINPLSDALKALGVWGKYSYEKFIPQSYLINSKEVRLELLRGLMDTDGTVSASGYETSFSTSSLQLAADVRSLVESLGGICPIRTRNTASGRLSYRLAICLPPDINPFHLPRKRDRVKPKTRYIPVRYIVSVEDEGEQECVCIAVDHPSQLYVTEHCLVTHNTTCVQHIVRDLLPQGKRIALTAPTNKAVRVLQRMASKNDIYGVDFFTIHQLLGLGLVRRGSNKVLEQTAPSMLSLFDLVFLDECSMVNKELWHWITENISRSLITNKQLILMGDPAQLPPVNEVKSLSFSVPDKAILTEVVRQGTDSPLLEFVTASRKAVKSQKIFKPFLTYLPDKTNGAFMVKENTLLRYAFKKVSKNFAQNPDCFRILCWTNKKVDYYNAKIRAKIYGENAPKFIVGERLITKSPVTAPDRKTIILPISTEIEVLEFCEDRYAGYKAWQLKVVTDEGTIRQIYVLHEDDTKRYKKDNARLLRNAKKNPSLWKAYYNHLEVFADLRNCYALTVHNSQGSTFDEVGIDGIDLNKNDKVRECNQLWYVASSRARCRVFVVR